MKKYPLVHYQNAYLKSIGRIACFKRYKNVKVTDKKEDVTCTYCDNDFMRD